MAMQMRFLQTLADVGGENNTAIVFPIPIDLFTPFLNNVDGHGSPGKSGTKAQAIGS